MGAVHQPIIKEVDQVYKDLGSVLLIPSINKLLEEVRSHARGPGRSTTWEGAHGLHNIITAYVVGRRCCRTLCNGLMGRANRELGLPWRQQWPE